MKEREQSPSAATECASRSELELHCSASQALAGTKLDPPPLPPGSPEPAPPPAPGPIRHLNTWL